MNYLKPFPRRETKHSFQGKEKRHPEWDTVASLRNRRIVDLCRSASSLRALLACRRARLALLGCLTARKRSSIVFSCSQIRTAAPRRCRFKSRVAHPKERKNGIPNGIPFSLRRVEKKMPVFAINIVRQKKAPDKLGNR